MQITVSGTFRGILSSIRWRLRNRFYLSYGVRGTAPINPSYGSGLGTPIDRYYIDQFLTENADAVTGRVLEVGDRSYTVRFARGEYTSDVLHVEPGEGVDVVADLACCPGIRDDTYDCVVLTQVLHVIYDMESAVREIHRILKPGGSVLCTVAGISQVNRGALEEYGDRWRLTSQSAGELFAHTFGADAVRVSTYGNALSAVCFLEGIPAERVKQRKLDTWEPDYQLIVCVVATKSAATATEAMAEDVT